MTGKRGSLRIASVVRPWPAPDVTERPEDGSDRLALLRIPAVAAAPRAGQSMALARGVEVRRGGRGCHRPPAAASRRGVRQRCAEVHAPGAACAPRASFPEPRRSRRRGRGLRAVVRIRPGMAPSYCQPPPPRDRCRRRVSIARSAFRSPPSTCDRAGLPSRSRCRRGQRGRCGRFGEHSRRHGVVRRN